MTSDLTTLLTPTWHTRVYVPPHTFDQIYADLQTGDIDRGNAAFMLRGVEWAMCDTTPGQIRIWQDNRYWCQFPTL